MGHFVLVQCQTRTMCHTLISAGPTSRPCLLSWYRGVWAVWASSPSTTLTSPHTRWRRSSWGPPPHTASTTSTLGEIREDSELKSSYKKLRNMKLFWWQLTHFQAIPRWKIASRLTFWACLAGKYSWTHPHTRKRKHQNVQNGKLETRWSFTDKKCWPVVELTQIYCWWVQSTQNSISCLTCWLSGCVVMCWTDNKGLSDHDIFIDRENHKTYYHVSVFLSLPLTSTSI